MQTIVIGHKNPDMDSICSAIGYARLKEITGMENVVAARAGNTNDRIDFVLGKFGVEAPMFVSDVSPCVRDVMHTHVISVRGGSAIYDALQIIDKHGLRGLPVLDDSDRLLGLLNVFKVGGHLYPPREKAARSRIVRASLAAIVKTFGGECICGKLSNEVAQHSLVVAAMDAETFDERMRKESPSRVVLFLYDRENIRRKALQAGIEAIVVTGGAQVDEEFREEAEHAGVTVIVSPHDTATTVLLARASLSVDNMLETDGLCFSPETPLESARDQVAMASAFVFPVTDEQGRVIGVFSKSDFLKPIQRQLILVDHNELAQAVPGADKLRIVEVLDHHKIGGFTTHSPILFWNNPIGSTSSIVALCYRQLGIAIPKDVAGLLMAGLISDTLNLTSPTATAFDKQILDDLAAITGVTPGNLAAEIFAVGSPLRTMSPAQAIEADSKEYTEKGHRFVVAQIEELSFTNLDEKREALEEALKAQVRARNLLFSALLVTDVNTQNSLLLACGAPEFRDTIDYPQRSPHVWELDGVVSRKKQLLPYLLDCLHKMPPLASR